MRKVTALRKKHPKFIYESFAYALIPDGLRITFTFVLEPNILFHPEILMCGVRKKELQRIPQETLDNLVFHLGLVEMLSYWKCAVSPVIEISAGGIAVGEIRFFEQLIEHGLGEFFYKNNIRFSKTFVRIISSGIARYSRSRKMKYADRRLRRASLSAGILFPLGGGKDSLAAIEILKKAHRIFRPMILGDVPAAYHLAKVLRTPEPITVRRRIDPVLMALNKKGYLNGHTPFSAYLAFLSTLTAELFGYRTIMVANERSANEPTFTLRGEKINPHTKRASKNVNAVSFGVGVNHQYSKSYAFERDFRSYAKQYLATQTSYLSILRPLYELQIAGIAAQYPKGLSAAVSCNVGQKEAKWCGACAKCMTVFILLYPFMETKALIRMFGKNLFEDGKLWPIIPELTGFGNAKPFDCVATEKEMRAALILSLKKSERSGKIPKLLLRFSREILPRIRMGQKDITRMLRAWDNNNFVPKPIARIIKNMIHEI